MSFACLSLMEVRSPGVLLRLEPALDAEVAEEADHVHAAHAMVGTKSGEHGVLHDVSR